MGALRGVQERTLGPHGNSKLWGPPKDNLTSKKNENQKNCQGGTI